MLKREDGSGMIGLLISLLILGVILWMVYIKPSKNSEVGLAKKQLESQGMSLPQGVNPNNVKDVQQMMNVEIEKAQKAREMQMCSVDAGAPGCAVPSTVPSQDQ